MKIEDFSNIPTLPAAFGPARQVAYIVDNIDAAMQACHDNHRIGPFLVTRNTAPLSNAFYRGEKAREARVNIAFAYVGDMQLAKFMVKKLFGRVQQTRRPLASQGVGA